MWWAKDKEGSSSKQVEVKFAKAARGLRLRRSPDAGQFSNKTGRPLSSRIYLTFYVKKSEKWLAYENIKEEVLEKIRKLEEERHAVDLWSCGPEWGRKRRRRQVTVSPPYVVYMLPDADIMEDWRLVRKLLERPEAAPKTEGVN
ncbi:unnamed protein product [Arctia plantaginis]|uniref:Uncharacterized protein n=1 Tax=Arctia plantaginis TaxID=874455 RepID=A0A8S0Z8D9_ARCPL|nr:unnamed protein product [Arctia plantaginis]CAB3228245.1 unnamed protein product [Arctia plantaginis]